MNNSSYLKLVKNNDNLRLLEAPFILINDLGFYIKDDYSIEHALHQDSFLRKTRIGKVLDKAKQSFYK